MRIIRPSRRFARRLNRNRRVPLGGAGAPKSYHLMEAGLDMRSTGSAFVFALPWHSESDRRVS